MSELRHLLGITGQKAILATISLLQKDSANLSEAVSANAGAEQSLSSAKSKIHTLEQQLKSKQAAATAAQSLLAGEKTSRSALMRELRQCNDELIDSQAESADMRTQAQHANAKSAVLTKQLKSAQKAALDAQTESADMQKQAQNADAKLPVLNEQLQCAQKSASDTQMRNAERKLESAMEELASLKTKNSSAKVCRHDICSIMAGLHTAISSNAEYALNPGLQQFWQHCSWPMLLLNCYVIFRLHCTRTVWIFALCADHTSCLTYNLVWLLQSCILTFAVLPAGDQHQRRCQLLCSPTFPLRHSDCFQLKLINL